MLNGERKVYLGSQAFRLARFYHVDLDKHTLGTWLYIGQIVIDYAIFHYTQNRHYKRNN